MAIAFTAPPKDEAKPEVRDLDLDLSAIRLDQSAQPRESLNNDRIAEYAEGMKAGDQFPPLTVFHDGETYWLADGFHRHYAAQHAGRKHIRCHVRQGGLRDAILWSVGANAKHGLARSDADKDRAVKRLLADDEWGQWSDRKIASLCKVDHKTVARIRKTVSGEVPQIERKVERGGTVYTQKVAKAKPAVVREIRTTEQGGGETKEITSETLAPQGGEGGAEPVSAKKEITSPRNIFDELVALWTEATAEDREAFIAYLRVLGSTITESSTGGGHVDRSAERASSAVKVGATNSNSSAVSSRQTSKAGAAATPPASAPATPFINLRCQKPETCRWAHSQASCSACNNAAMKARAQA